MRNLWWHMRLASSASWWTRSPFRARTGICETIEVLEGKRRRISPGGHFNTREGLSLASIKSNFFQGTFLPQNILRSIEREDVDMIYRKLSEYYGRGNYMGKPMEEAGPIVIAEAFSR